MPLYPLSNKVINDPIYGLIQMPGGIGFELINHRWFQRLRRIQQLGMSNLVFHGAEHSRFNHTMGCVYLMQHAIDVLHSKGADISPTEAEGAILAILLHDIGHGPFSHALENLIVPDMSHEDITLLIINILNKKYNHGLDTAIEIFNNRYPKPFLHQLVSSQLDTDRLDYLKRDSFFTGVSEGIISTDRIIKMFNISQNQLVIDQKGIYSIEKFLIARRLMYWQVYLHKTVVSAEQMLKNIIRYARYLSINGEKLPATPTLSYFLSSIKVISESDLEQFTLLDDTDIISSIKMWMQHTEPFLQMLCKRFLNRNLSRMQISNTPFDKNLTEEIRKKAIKYFSISEHQVKYLVYSDTLSNKTYTASEEQILILTKKGEIQTMVEASDMFHHEIMSKTIMKYYLCYPKELDN